VVVERTIGGATADTNRMRAVSVLCPHRRKLDENLILKCVQIETRFRFGSACWAGALVRFDPADRRAQFSSPVEVALNLIDRVEDPATERPASHSPTY
jgi:hypothetical protein